MQKKHMKWLGVALLSVGCLGLITTPVIAAPDWQYSDGDIQYHLGRVGVGLDDPTKQLEVNNDIRVSGDTLNDGMPKVINLSLAGRDQDRNTQWAWLFQTGDEDSQQWGFGPRNLEFREYVTSTNNSSEYRRRFVIESSYGETANVNELPSLYLTSDSKLGIGSGEPTATLDVQNRTDTPGFTGRRDLANFANWKNNAMTISMFGSGHPVTPNTVQLGAWNNQSIAIVSDTKAKVQAGGSTKGLFVQRVSGNVGIKTNDPKEALQIGNNFTFHSGGNKVISYNSYYKVGENVSRRISNGPASSIFFTNNGSVGIRTANNSTKDSQVNWKSRLVVNNDGSVCIGNC